MTELFAQLLAEMTMPQVVFMGGLMILIGILLTRSRGYFRRKAREGRTVAPPAQPAAPRANHRLENPAEMQRWEVEMQELARELSARLDSKMVALEQIIRDADAATARLQAAVEGSGSAPQQRASTTVAPSSVRPLIEADHPPDVFHAAYGPASTEDPRYRAIYELADQGLSRDVIARRVGTPAGEVDLILSLRGKK